MSVKHALWELADKGEAKSDVLEPALVSFVNDYSTAAVLPDDVFTEAANTKLMKFLLSSLASASALGWNASTYEQSFLAMKVISRTKKGMLTVCQQDVVNLIMDVCQQHVEPGESPITNQGLRVIINTIVSHQDDMIPLLENYLAHQKCMKMLSVTKNNILHFTICRLLFYLGLNKKIAGELAASDIYDILFGIFFSATEQEFEKDDDQCRAASEVLKVLFIIHSESPYQGDRTRIVARIAEVIKKPIRAASGSSSESKATDGFDHIQTNLLTVKLHIIDLMWTEKEVPPVAISQDNEVLDGFLELLDIQAHNKEAKPEAALSPLLFVLKGLCLTDAVALKKIKTYIFGDHAEPKEDDPPPQDAMKPVGWETDDPNSTKTILIKHILSFHTTLKYAATEFFYALAQHDSTEYIRLVGLGSAAGLLAEKGMPGFSFLGARHVEKPEDLNSDSTK